MAKNLEEKTLFSGEKVKVVGAEYEEGMPEQPHLWRGKIQGRQEMIKYLQTGETVLVQQGMVRERKAEDAGVKKQCQCKCQCQ